MTTPRILRDIPSHVAEAIEAACEADRLWFDAHPLEALYTREPVDYEFGGVLVGPYRVEVEKLGPGLRSRHLVALSDDTRMVFDGAEPFSALESAQALRRTVRGGE